MLRVYKTFYSFLLKYPWRFSTFIITTLLWGTINSINPYFYKLFIDAIPNRNFDQLLSLLFIYILTRIIQICFDMLTYFLGDRLVIPAARDARLTVFKKIHDLDFAFHSSKSTGSLISAIKRGDGAFFSAFDTLNVDLARITVNFFVVLVFFFFLHPSIAGVLLVVFIINIIAARFLIIINMKKRKEFNNAEDEISDIIVDNMINYETVKLFAREEWEQKRLQERFRNWAQKLWGFANTFRVIELTIGGIGNIGLFFVLLLTIQQVTSFKLTPGEFILILGFISDFYPKFFQLVFRFRDLAKHYTDLQIYFSILDNQTLIKDPLKPVKKTEVDGEIEFKNISFTYPEAKDPSLKDFSLHIRQGQSVALVGRSGVGKSTIVKLIMRLYDVQKGEVLVDGINIKKFTKTQLRSFMGVVPQEPVLFNDTIGFNISYGADNPTQQEIEGAAKMAFLDDFIQSLPQKYETNVGERGIKLSGGQKQRLAIARMILSNPDIIIFDEATSHLDSESEKAIQEGFWKAAKGKTSILIAHRLSTIVQADKIVVLDENGIAEMGSHRQLIAKKNGLYKHFWELQSDIE